MRVLLSTLLLALGAGASSAALAQNCGSGGGATACLVANGAADKVLLNWTLSGAVNGLEIYRNTSADPTGRSRIASLAKTATSYGDSTANIGTPYWYWVKFTTAAGSYNSGASSATRGGSCTPTAVMPWVNVNGSWAQTANATVSLGDAAVLGPQPGSGGTWTWNGCGTAGGAREQTIRPTAACTATATYTNACGAKTLQSFTIATAGAMRNITSLQMSKEMSPGWNLGNSLDAPTETGWGNPAINQGLLNAVRAAGFKSVRIPVTWTTHVDANDNIDPAYMARVTEVVKYVRNTGMYAIINLHHEGSWLDNVFYANQAANNARLAKLWTQIANNFKNHDDYLLFAGMNEVGKENAPWGVPPQQEWVDVQNGYHQVFVNAVRATGGNNARRHLVIQGYFTGIDPINQTVLPTDTIANRLFFEFHFYDPYTMALAGESPIYQWGALTTDQSKADNWANEAYVDAQFQKVKSRFVDAGVPAIMGEYGVILKSEYDPAGFYRTEWAKYVTHSAVSHGIVPMWWDNGYQDNHQFGLFNRTTGAQYFPVLIKGIVDNAK
ncbi:glycoside hydrolase family 5 protein [Roseateles sp.]|uniref:glycoside hydrolase family 5 protein n=1 Tax=Roseateles sp. TaxID=1971397 RepID=UPI002E0C98E0|nr:glycoside hydrolase family 5 protein [Roseateles sp.]